MEALVRLLWSKDVVGTYPTGFEESLVYQLYSTAKGMQMKRNLVQMLKQQKRELRIPSIVLSTKHDVLLLIGEAKYKLVFGRQRKTFWMQNSRTRRRIKILGCVTFRRSSNTFGIDSPQTCKKSCYDSSSK